MSWEIIDKKHKRKYKRDYVTCESYTEKEFIIESILEHYPGLYKPRVEKAIYECCSKMQHPCKRSKFIEYLKMELSV